MGGMWVSQEGGGGSGLVGVLVLEACLAGRLHGYGRGEVGDYAEEIEEVRSNRRPLNGSLG